MTDVVAEGAVPSLVLVGNEAAAASSEVPSPSRLISRPWLPLVLLGVLCLFSIVTRSAWIGTPDRVVFDESYYVNAARVLNGDRPPGGAAYSTFALGIDPNREHPPLGKVIIAASIRLLGDRPLGWRAPSLAFGTVAVVALFCLARAVGASRWLALGAAAVMALENLFLVHGRIATLDVIALAIMLVGATVYLRGRPVLAGMLLGIGACAKVIVLSTLGVLVLFEVLRFGLGARHGANQGRFSLRRAPIDPRLARIFALVGVAGVAYLAVLFALDLRYTNFANPVAHTRYMAHYAKNLPERPRSRPGFTVAPSSRPVAWLANREPILYYQQVTPDASRRTLVLFQGRMSPLVIFLAVPAFGLAGVGAWRRRDELSLLVVAWCVATFGTFVVISLDHNFNYLYYMLIVLPGVYLGIARMLAARWVPRFVPLCYGIALAYGLFAMYPIRSWGGR